METSSRLTVEAAIPARDSASSTIPVTPFSLRADLRAARSALNESSTVLDHLLARAQSAALSQVELRALLLAQAGVEAVFSSKEAKPVNSHLQGFALRALGLVPIQVFDREGVFLAASDPWDADLASEASALLKEAPKFVAVPQVLLQGWLSARSAAGAAAEEAELPVAGETVSFVDNALRTAFEVGASDVHFEYSRAGIAVKLRQDGVMTDLAQMLGTTRADEVISRIKVLAQLDITERRVPQDGRFRFDFEAGSIDMRVSIMPSVFGEDAVLRLLDKAQLRTNEEAVSLDRLGFDADSVDSIRELAELPHGMMLITGPTGSGKTTTVYAILSEVNNGQEKIITIEDPVEYELSGVLQIPVNERKGLTFAKGLRSILRHDPDRILVGEIRDAETAEIAVQSALTGHQVFTTVHANSIFDVTGRFRHFGLDMFGFMSALNGLIVQRLVRRLCPHCSGRRSPTERERRWMLNVGLPLDEVTQAVGCPQCRHTGYRGRVVIAEVHRIDDVFRDMVTGNAPVSRLRDHVVRAGVKSLSEQSVRLIGAGMTTTEEIKRVVGWS